MRRVKEITIAESGRDHGKTFLITELPAADAEDWFERATRLLVTTGAEVPSNIFQHGPQGFAVMGIGAALAGLARAPWYEVKTLLAEMMACVALRAGPMTVTGAVMESQIEEIATRLRLREEVLSLHLGFSLRDALSRYRDMVVAMTSISPTTPTSADPSAPS